MIENALTWTLPAVRGLLVASLILFLATMFDDLLVDLLFVTRRLARRLLRREGACRLTVEDLRAVPEKPIAVLIPAWKASTSILQMLLHTAAVLDYRKYHLFVGVYPNDEQTRFEVEKAREVHPNIDVVLMPHDGPTTDADCVNWLYHGVHVFEQDMDARFDLFVIHGPSDVVHPLSLKWFNRAIPRAHLVQAPVFPFPDAGAGMAAGVLMDAAAEEYTRLFRAREALSGTLSCAGAGLAVSRRAAGELARRNSGQIFDPAVALPGMFGMRLHDFGDETAWAGEWLPTPLRVRRRTGRLLSREPVATRRVLPATFGDAVRAATRRIGGAVDGRCRRGPGSSIAAAYFVLRERKRLVAAMAAALAVPVALYAALALAVRAAGADAIPPLLAPGGLTVRLLALAAGLLAWRTANRAWATGSVYGWRQGLLAVPRLAVDAAIHVAALSRVPRRLTRAARRARPHGPGYAAAFPSAAQLRGYHRRLGELLLERRFIKVDDLQEALARQKDTGRRLGDLLVSMGALREEDLITVLAAQRRADGVAVDSRAACPELRALVPERLAREFRVFPVRTEGETLLLATDALVAAARREELAAEIGRPIELQWCAGRDVDIALRETYDRRDATPPAPARILGDRLVDAGRISEEVLNEALRRQKRTNRKLGEILVSMGVITVSDLNVVLSEAA